MKIALVQQNYKIGDLEANAAKIIEAIHFAHSEGAAVVVFGADALSGTPLLNMGRSAIFAERAASVAEHVRDQVGDGIEPLFASSNGDGIDYHCAADIFRHNLPNERLAQLCERAAETGSVQVWVNQVGAQTDAIFFGGSMVCFPDGRVVTLPLFEEAVQVVDLDNSDTVRAQWGDRIGQIHSALVLGIRDYFSKNGCSDACIAFSGGIDSAVVLALSVEALGADHVQTLMLPSQYSSDHSVADSLEMNRRLGVRGEIVSIEPVYNAAHQAIDQILSSATEAAAALARENMQSRIRLMLTMALSNSHSALMLNTSNKSEAAVGYGTLYGDTSGALSVIGDLYKCDVYALARHINQTYGDVIPENIITKEPSAELRPDQRDSDSLPDYPILDAVLERLIERGMSSSEVVADGFDVEVVAKVCRMLTSGDFKRYQLPPALRVSGCSFGHEWRYPITAAKRL